MIGVDGEKKGHLRMALLRWRQLKPPQEAKADSPALQGGEAVSVFRVPRARHIRLCRASPTGLSVRNIVKPVHMLASNLVHCVFSTKDRANLIPNPERAWQYISGIARTKQIPLIAIGGTRNHIHLLLLVRRQCHWPKPCKISRAIRPMAQRDFKRFRMAAGLRRIQCQRIAKTRCDRLHWRTRGASSEEEFRAGVFDPLAQFEDRI